LLPLTDIGRILLPTAALMTAATAAASPRSWEVSGSAATGTPAVLDGLSLGATAEATRGIGARGAFFSARLGWTAASAANTSWIIDHHQFIAAVGAGISATLGAGRVWAQAGGGTTVLYEILSRHQRGRIEAANVPGAVETSLSLGPHAFAELGLAVRMRGRVSGFLAAGPTVCRAGDEGALRWRPGVSARLGVAYDF
jgi:hypothetical protein